MDTFRPTDDSASVVDLRQVVRVELRRHAVLRRVGWLHPSVWKMQRQAAGLARVKSTDDILKRLTSLLSHSRTNVPYYSNALAGIRDARLDELPILTRDILQTRTADLLARMAPDRRLPGRAIRIETTSGSSGAPAHHFQTAHDAMIDAGLLLRLYRELQLPIAGQFFNLGLHRAGQPLLETRIVPGAYTYWNLRSAQNGGAKVEYAVALASARPTVIYGAASRLRELAEYVLNAHLAVRPRAVLSSYEQLSAATRGLLEQTFRCPVRSVYGSTELGLCAWECEQGALHVQADQVIPEVIDDLGAPVPRGTPGRLIFTSLKSWLMPLVRYDTGDIAALRREGCACGSTFPVLSPFEGRRAAYLYTRSGRAASPYKLMSIVDRTGVARYQLVQREKGSAELILDCSDDAVDLRECEAEISAFLGEEFRLYKHAGAPFIYTATGKLNPVLSFVDTQDALSDAKET